MQSHSTLLKTQIVAEILKRGWSFAVPQLPCLLVFALFSAEIFSDPIFLSAFVTIMLSSLLLVVFMMQKSVTQDIHTFEKILAGVFMLFSIGWMAILTLFFYRYGMVSEVSLLTAVITCGIAAGAFILINPSAVIFHSFFVPYALIPSIACIPLITNLKELTILLLMGIYNIFLTFSARPIRTRFQESVLNAVILQAEKNKTDAIINAFPGVVSLIDDQQVYQSINAFGQNLFDLTEVKGRVLGSFQTANHEFVTMVKNFYTQKHLAQKTQEMQLNTVDGKHWFIVSMTRLAEPRGWVAVISVMIDELITARNQAEKEKAKADYAARLASLGEMAQGVAHEINNPLAVVMFSAEEINNRARRNDLDPDFVEKFSTKINQMSQRIAKIVKGLRYFSRDAGNDPLKSVPVSQVIALAQDFRSERFKNYQIELSVIPYDESLEIQCREVQIVQVLINLLNNSFDAIKENAEKWIHLEVLSDDELVTIRVIDSGRGISPENQAKIFEPFFSTKEVNQGSGLGLSISLGLMQGNGGALRYVPAENTTFEMQIPRSR